jgi:hypothetical protein
MAEQVQVYGTDPEGMYQLSTWRAWRGVDRHADLELDGLVQVQGIEAIDRLALYAMTLTRELEKLDVNYEEGEI